MNHDDTPSRASSYRLTRGFTLVEMLIVVALIGIVAGLALPQYRNSTVRAKESVLKHDLWVMRDLIDQFFTDQGRYPSDLDELVSTGYLRRIPTDPFTKSNDSWETTRDSLAEDDLDSPEQEEPGITDVHSTASGRALDGTTYSEW